MRTRIELEQDETRILSLLYEYKHLTTEDLHYFLFEAYARRTVERKIQSLLATGYIQAQPVLSHRQGRNHRVFSLLRKGAIRIGKDSLPNQHYRHEREDYRLYNIALLQLRHLAEKQNWQLHESEEQCQNALYFYLAMGGVADVTLLLPRKIVPDVILVTADNVPNICIRAHPNADRGFFHARFDKYVSLLDKCRGIAVVLNDSQAEQARSVLEGKGLERRVLVKNVESLRTLSKLVNPAKGEG